MTTMTRRIVPVVFALLLPGGPVAVRAQSQPEVPVADPLVRVQQTIARAKQLVADGEIKESLDVVRELLKHGPPQRIGFTALFQALSGSRTASESSQAVSRAVAEGMLELDELWRDKDASPDAVCDMLQVIVFPASRRKEMFVYAVQSGTPTSVPDSVARLLVDWSARADRSRDVARHVSDWFEENVPTEGRLLLIRLAHVADDIDGVLTQLNAIQEALSGEPGVEMTLSLLPAIDAALRNEDTAFEALDLLDRAIDVLQTNAATVNWQTLATLLRSAARESFELADSARGVAHLQSLLQLYEQHVVARSSAHETSRVLCEVAREYLHGDQLTEGLEVLGQVADLRLSVRNGVDDGLASTLASLNRRLLALDSEERYLLLRDWSMPTDTRRHVRNLVSITPHTGPPSVFARALGERPERDGTSFPVPVAGRVTGLCSTSWLLVNAAREAGLLRSLMTIVAEHAEENVAGADTVLLLARIAASDDVDEELREDVSRQLLSLSGVQSESDTIGAGWRRSGTPWQYGYGTFDAATGKTVGFQPLRWWTGTTWQGGPDLPDDTVGWLQLDQYGGRPGPKHDAVRRWIAPASGVVSFLGVLQSTGEGQSDGVVGRIISSRSGLAGEWTVDKQPATAGPLSVAVRKGDTIDFAVNRRANSSWDKFFWSMQMTLLADDGRAIRFQTHEDFHGPAAAYDNTLDYAALGGACLERDWLHPFAVDTFNRLVTTTFGAESWILRPFYRRAHAISVHHHFAGSESDVIGGRPPLHWIPASAHKSSLNAEGAVPSIWLAQEDHIIHLSGPRNDSLLFRYPIVGDFEFSVEAQDGGPFGTEGGIVYGGLNYEAWGAGQSFKVWDADVHNEVRLPCPFPLSTGRPEFNRLSVRRSADGVTFSSNGHAVWTDRSGETDSPWIGLRCFNDRRPIFRNLKITGGQIPREVVMLRGDSLLGWLAGYFDQRTPTPLPVGNRYSAFGNISRSEYDWIVSDGVLHGPRRGQGFDAVRQRRLTYGRPLLNGESVSYEFYYEPGRFQVHPAIGRLVFAMEPSGIRLRWIADGTREWSGLPTDNSVVEPGNRRGPRSLPLKSGQWNQATVTFVDDALTVALNGEEVYVREMEDGAESRFGFFHDPSQSEAQVRNVVMRGDWPESLTEELQSQLAAAHPDLSDEERHAQSILFEDRYIAEHALAVHQRAMKMSAEDRYPYLSDWVLPGRHHPELRIGGAFTQTSPAPIVSREGDGGQLVSPVIDLVDTARELGQLDALRSRVAGIDSTGPARLALLILIDLERDDAEAAVASFEQLFAQTFDSFVTDFTDRWPETLAMTAGMNHTDTRPAARELLDSIYDVQLSKWKRSGSEAWELHLRRLMGLGESLDRAAKANASPEPLRNWAPASLTTMRSRGEGRPLAKWERVGDEVYKVSGHEQDYLMYRIPLRGNYVVECDLAYGGWRESHLMVAGTFVAPNWNGRQIDVGVFQTGKQQTIRVVPPLAKFDPWIRFRVVVHDGICVTYVNGRAVHTQPIPERYEPWLSVRGWNRFHTGIRNLRIFGDPVIPETIVLSDQEKLPGWAHYSGEWIGPNLSWRQRGGLPNGGGIVGRHRPDLPGADVESLVRYHRPMLEDGTIEYEFYYRAGESLTHPALDRLAFMLQPDGIREHWVTDGPHDRSGLAPDNIFDEPDHRRGPTELPLLPGAWNHMQVTLSGDVVLLILNDVPVYERLLEPGNQRTFGLFHFADRTEARVRNVRWTGDWPSELPSVAEQELSGEGTEFLDDALPELTAVFEHDFAKDGLPSHQFSTFRGRADFFNVTDSGLHVVRKSGDGGYLDSTLIPRLIVEGDYDITARFEQLQTDVDPPPGISTRSVFLQTIADNATKFESLIYRRHLRRNGRDYKKIVESAFVTREAAGGRRDPFDAASVEATSGRLRLARRGETVYCLFAENDSPTFRLYGSMSSDKAPLATDGLRLVVQTHGPGEVSVIWRSLVVRAESLSGPALEDHDAQLAQLNAERVSLASRVKIDFTKDTPGDRFHQWGHPVPLAASDDGVRIVNQGTDKWTSCGLAPHVALSGDFDVQLDLNGVKLETPKKGQHTSVYLQVHFSDPDSRQINLLFRELHTGRREIHLHHRGMDDAGKFKYLPVSGTAANAVASIRIARRGSELFGLYRLPDDDTEYLLGRQTMGDWPVADASLRVLIHTGGEDRTTELNVEAMSIHASEITSDHFEIETLTGK